MRSGHASGVRSVAIPFSNLVGANAADRHGSPPPGLHGSRLAAPLSHMVGGLRAAGTGAAANAAARGICCRHPPRAHCTRRRARPSAPSRAAVSIRVGLRGACARVVTLRIATLRALLGDELLLVVLSAVLTRAPLPLPRLPSPALLCLMRLSTPVPVRRVLSSLSGDCSRPSSLSAMPMS